MLTDVGHVLVHVGGVNGKSDASQVRCSIYYCCTRTKVQTLTQTALLGAVLLVTNKGGWQRHLRELSSVLLALLVQKYKY